MLSGCAEKIPFISEFMPEVAETEITAIPTEIPIVQELPIDVTEEILLTETEPETETIPETEAVTEVSGTGDFLYDTMYSAFSQYETKVSFDVAVSQEELEKTYRKLNWEHPELFWLDGYVVTTWSNSAELECRVIDSCKGANLPAMYAEMEQKCDEITAQAQGCPTDYEKVLFVHDYLVEHTEYDTAGARSDKHDLWNTAYGCLIRGNAVCQGYAEAFQMIMEKLGIPCGVCSGVAKYESHAWNYVCIDGVYYWIDVTWDDPVREGGELKGTSHIYFLLDDEMMFRTRTLDEDNIFVPQCNSIQNNYYVRNGNYLTEYSFDEINRRMSENMDTGSIELMYSDRASFQTAVQKLFNEGEVWKTSAFAMGGSVQYSYDDDMYTIWLKFSPN